LQPLTLAEIIKILKILINRFAAPLGGPFQFVHSSTQTSPVDTTAFRGYIKAACKEARNANRKNQ
jgi:hypothetical protein